MDKIEMSVMTNAMESLPYRAMVKCALRMGLPGNYKRKEYIQLFRLHGMGLDFEFKTLAHTMKTKRQAMKKSISNKCVKKRSVGRPRKSNIKVEIFSESSSENTPLRTSVIKKMPHENVHIYQTTKLIKSNSNISQMRSSGELSVTNIVKSQPPITKTTSELLRNKLLSTDRTKFRSTTTNGANYTSNKNPYYKYYEYNSSKPLNLEVPNKYSSYIDNTCTTKWKNNKILNMPVEEINITSNLPNLQAFPDIPLLADVDINASFEQDNSNYSITEQTDTDTLVCIDDSDTLSNQSAEHTEQEQQDFDQRWAMTIRMDNGEITPLVNYETFNSLDESSLLGFQDSSLVQTDLIQNYIETNDVHFMQLPDSSCEVIRTLQYYESRLLNSPWSFPEHNLNGSILNEQTEADEQLNLIGGNQNLAEFANMLPCPIAGCLWYSHSSTLYVHLFSCHQEMIYYGNSITHVFKCQDIHNFCFFTHLQYIQGTIYIITVAFDSYSHTFVATIQHVSSIGDNTSVSSTTAILTTGSHYNNIDQHSWTGQVQPYSVPLDLLHSDGRCLFIDPINSSERLVINVNLTFPLTYSNDSMLACL